jgi:hypothetical protein
MTQLERIRRAASRVARVALGNALANLVERDSQIACRRRIAAALLVAVEMCDQMSMAW